MKIDAKTKQMIINIKGDMKYRIKILALIRTEKRKKRIASADIVREALEGVLRYNKDDIDEYIDRVIKTEATEKGA